MINPKPYILALYDIRGIQDFIFNTNKLKENIGGSYLIQSVLEDLKKILQLEELENPQLNDLISAEIDAFPIYVAGGNALVLYNNKKIESSITKSYSKKILKHTGNDLFLMVATVTTNMENLSHDIKKLHKQMQQNKDHLVQSKPRLGIGITDLENQTDLPLQFYDENDEEYLSLQTVIKREQAERCKNYFKKKLIENNEYLDSKNKQWNFPSDLDRLRFKEGEHHIALVHLDGNNMGDLVQQLIDEETDYKKGVKLYSLFSKEVEKIINNAMKRTLSDLTEKLDEFVSKDILKKENRYSLPIRPIILSGDDITFISHGQLGIGLAENLIRNVEDERNSDKYEIDLLKENLSLSGGVLITNYKFPFSRAYPLLEELARSAKLKGKIYYEKNHNPTSWLDFQIINSGISSNLESMRNRLYCCPGCEKPQPLEKRYNDTILKMGQYNLLCRPYVINSKSKLEDDINLNFLWRNIRDQVIDLKSKNSDWPRSNLKRLQKSFHVSKEKVREVILENKRRGRKLPFSDKLESGDWTQTPYYDIIELIDYYNEIPNKGD
jgi:hypothetical protein